MTTPPKTFLGDGAIASINILKQRNLVDRSQQHIRFLQGLHAAGVSLETPDDELIRRYKDLWLPLLYSNHGSGKKTNQELNVEKDAEQLIPPADIAWIWHCHRLAPLDYEKFIRQTFHAGCTNNQDCRSSPKPFAPFAFQLPSSSDDTRGETRNGKDNKPAGDSTRRLWKAVYPEEAFFRTNTSGTIHDSTPSNKKSPTLSLGQFDVLSSCHSQSKFLWQVSGPQYSSRAFLEQAVADYGRFLHLKNHAQAHQILVPTIAIDLIWHTHILDFTGGYDYKRDCLEIMGCPFHHDDSLPHAELEVYFDETVRLWESQYGNNYMVKGCMNRGEPPVAYFEASWVQKEGPRRQSSKLDVWLTSMLGILLLSPLGAIAWWKLSCSGWSQSRFYGHGETTRYGNGKPVDFVSLIRETAFESPTDTTGRALSDVFDSKNNETDATAPSMAPSQSSSPTIQPMVPSPSGPPTTQPTDSSSIRNMEWVCGGGHQEPSAYAPNGKSSDVQLPKCLKIQPYFLSGGGSYERPTRPLCLSSTDEQPPIWCYEPSDHSTDTFYLYYSPCQDCGPAWRLDQERNDRKSYYKNPTADPTKVPPALEGPWLRWSSATGSWTDDMDVLIDSCDPDAHCWRTPIPVPGPGGGSGRGAGGSSASNGESDSSWAIGLIGGLILAVFCGVGLCYCLCPNEVCSEGRKRGEHGRRGGGWSGCGGGGGGGGCGGGGGGCGGGGGGGGCGGC